MKSINKKEYYRQIANETISICEQGWYIYNGRMKVYLRDNIKSAVDSTKVTNYKLPEQPEKNPVAVNIEFVSTTTLEALLKSEKIPTILNFASAKYPGGGFKNGVNTQEESITRPSALYSCLMKKYEYYKQNLINDNSGLYTDKMIISSKVPYFRNEHESLLKQPVCANVITSPAVNAKYAKTRGVSNEDINSTMAIRIDKIIYTACREFSDTTLILGAYGCGVFGNDLEKVAKMFKRSIDKYSQQLLDADIDIVFAIPDAKTLNLFRSSYNK